MNNNQNQEQGIINCKRPKTFSKEPKLARLLRELKPTLVSYNKKSPLVFVFVLGAFQGNL